MTMQRHASPRSHLVALCLLPAAVLFGCHDEPSLLAPTAIDGMPLTPSITSLEEIPEAWEQIPEGELAALLSLYEATGGDNWQNNDGWLDEDTPPSEWHGVIVQDGQVKSLNLPSNNLTGEIPPALGNLPALSFLNLQFNNLGGEIPPALGNLASLATLSLGNNRLSGQIPSALGGLASLSSLNLAHNNLSGEIPVTFGALQNLGFFFVHNNNLSGRIPPELGDLGNLIWLALSANNFSGEIPPQFGKLESLEFLFLDRNNLSGEIPPGLGRLRDLSLLNVSRNNLSGQVPSELGDLETLRSLRIDVTNLSGPLPRTVTRLALEFFWFHDTDLCEPRDRQFQEWLAGIPNLMRTDVLCQGTTEGVVRPQLDEAESLRMYFSATPRQALTFRGKNFDTRASVVLRELLPTGEWREYPPISGTRVSVNADQTQVLAWAGLGIDAAQWEVQVVNPGNVASHPLSFEVFVQRDNEQQTPTGWYYPLQTPLVDTPGFEQKTMYITVGWLARDRPDYIQGRAHLGVDLRASRGTPVHAIGDGIVVGMQGPGAGWGEGNFAVAIRHECVDGPFVAVYGHVRDLDVGMNDPVVAGQKIAEIGPFPEGGDHLHFGIAPGAAPPGTSPTAGWGLMHSSHLDSGTAHFTNGFVDPMHRILTTPPAGS